MIICVGICAELDDMMILYVVIDVNMLKYEPICCSKQTSKRTSMMMSTDICEKVKWYVCSRWTSMLE